MIKLTKSEREAVLNAITRADNEWTIEEADAGKTELGRQIGLRRKALERGMFKLRDVLR